MLRKLRLRQKNGFLTKKRVEAFARNFSFLAVILIRLLEKQNSLHLPVFSIFFSLRLFQNTRKFGAKKYFTDQGTVNTIQLIVAIKGNLSSIFCF